MHYRILIFTLFFYSVGIPAYVEAGLQLRAGRQYSQHSDFPQEKTPKGTIKGRLLDGETKAPLVGANVEVLNTIMGTATDEQGQFFINDVPVGSYSLRFSYIGYRSATQTDVIVRPHRITFFF